MNIHEKIQNTQTLADSSANLATDFLPTHPSPLSFSLRLQKLRLSHRLEDKILTAHLSNCTNLGNSVRCTLTKEDENELATEVLLARHAFTNKLLAIPEFRQATLTVIQNIYLFKNRKIFFFSSPDAGIEADRQIALQLFSDPTTRSLRLSHTLQHLIVARVWRRIIGDADLDSSGAHFSELQAIVGNLNMLRNCYMLLAQGLVRARARKLTHLYRNELPYEDAVQVGLMGIGRAAYRYHPQQGVRFSTFAANYINREIQQQALSGRLIRLSSNAIEKYARDIKNGETRDSDNHLFRRITSATLLEDSNLLEALNHHAALMEATHSQQISETERREMVRFLSDALDNTLSTKSADLLRRRFGLPPYERDEQSIVDISREYGVTRSALYQMEKNALHKLRIALQKDAVSLD